MKKIIFTEVAKQRLFDIYRYHKKEATTKVAKSIIKNIFTASQKLKKYPLLGNEEAYLKPLKRNYRKLIIGNYKLIYRVIDNTVFIDTIFDSRQQPIELTKDVE